MKTITTFALLGLTLTSEDKNFLGATHLEDKELHSLFRVEKNYQNSHFRGTPQSKFHPQDTKHFDPKKLIEIIISSKENSHHLNQFDQDNIHHNKGINRLDDNENDDSLYNLDQLLQETSHHAKNMLKSGKPVNHKMLNFEDNNLSLWSSFKEGVKKGINWISHNPHVITAGPQSFKKVNGTQIIKSFHDNSLFEIDEVVEGISKKYCIETSHGKYCFDEKENKDEEFNDNNLAQICIPTKFGRICYGK